MPQCLLLFMFLLLLGTACMGAVVVYRLWCLEGGQPQHVRGLWLLLGASLLALALRLWCVPQMHYVFYDEFLYMAEARNIMCWGTAGQVFKGSAVDPEVTSHPAPRVGFSLLMAIVASAATNSHVEKFRVADWGERCLFLFNMMLGVLSVALIFRIAWRATGKLSLAWWSAVALAMLPSHIKYSSSLSADAAVLFFSLLSIMCLLEWAVLRQKLLILTALFAGAYSACIKPVYLPFLVVGLFLVIFPLYRRKELRGGELADIIYYVLCIVVPMALIFAHSTALEVEGRSGPIYSWTYLKYYIVPNLRYLVNYRYFNVVATVLGVIGILRAIFFRRNAFSIVMGLWFCLGLILVSGYFAGGLSSQTFYDSDRFFFTIAMPFAFLVALGVQAVYDLVADKGRVCVISGGAIILVLLAINAIYSSRVLAAFTTTRFAYKQLLFLQKATPLLPSDAYVMDTNFVFSAIAPVRKVIRPELFISGDMPRKIIYFASEDSCGVAVASHAPEQQIRAAYSCRLLLQSSSQLTDGCVFRAYACDKVSVNRPGN